MKRIYICLIFILSISSCARHIPIKGTYKEGSIKAEFEFSYDKVWEGVIELIAERGLDVKMVDKSSGLIISDRNSFFGHNTYEEAVSKPKNPKAFILTSRTSDNYNPMPYADVSAVYNIRVKSEGLEKTLVSINLHSIKIPTTSPFFPYRGISLGNFERSLFDDINFYLNQK